MPELMPGTLKALVFDLDGTLVDTDLLHFAVYQEVLRDYGFELGRDFYHAEMSGVPNMAIMHKLLPHLSIEEKRALVERKENGFRSRTEGLAPVAGLGELLAWADERELALSLVTSAPGESARLMLGALELSSRFPVTVLAEELPRGKPDPLPYLTALERLGLTAAEALVFEDAPAGVRSAVAAGIFTIGVATTQAPENLAAAGARLVVGDYTDPELWSLLRARL